MSTYGAMDGGIIYVQGQGEACKQSTKSGMAMHEFDFEQCGIQWVRMTIKLDSKINAVIVFTCIRRNLQDLS